jgi:hypothetical protein
LKRLAVFFRVFKPVVRWPPILKILSFSAFVMASLTTVGAYCQYNFNSALMKESYSLGEAVGKSVRAEDAAARKKADKLAKEQAQQKKKEDEKRRRQLEESKKELLGGLKNVSTNDGHLQDESPSSDDLGLKPMEDDSEKPKQK